MRKAYKIIRNIVFSIVLGMAALYVLLYLALSLPFVQNYAKEIACNALNEKTGGSFEIENVSISPFNKVVLEGVSVKDPEGKPVATAREIGAGIGVWDLIIDQRVVVTFGMIIGLDGRITQPAPGKPTNIQFLIDAFKPKDKKKPPTRFDLEINNIVLRDCAVSFDKLWLPKLADASRFDPNHIKLSHIAADMRLPIVRNDDFLIDLRRISLRERAGFVLTSMSGRFTINKQELAYENLMIELPGSKIDLGSRKVEINGFKDIPRQFLAKPQSLALNHAHITPSDFSAFLPVLANYLKPLTISVAADYFEGNLNISNLALNMQEGIKLNMRGKISGIGREPQDLRIDLPMLALDADGNAVSSLLTDFAPLPSSTAALIRRLGNIALRTKVAASQSMLNVNGSIDSAPGSATLKALVKKRGETFDITADVLTPGFELGKLLDNELIGRISVKASGSGSIGKGVLEGNLKVDAPYADFKGYRYSGLTADVSKHGSALSGHVAMLDENVDFNIDGEADLGKSFPHIDLNGAVRKLNLSALNLANQYADINLSTDFDICFSGNNIDNINGYANFSSLQYSDSHVKDIALDYLRIESNHEALPYSISVESDLLTARAEGDFNLRTLPASMRNLASHFLPALVKPVPGADKQDYSWKLTVNHASPLLEKLKLPVTLLQDLEITGDCNTQAGTAALNMYLPYLQQGRDKLIRETRLKLELDTLSDLCDLQLSTVFPNKLGDIDLRLGASARADSLFTDIGWHFRRPRAYKGNVSLTGIFNQDERGEKAIDVLVNPSKFEVNDTVWNIDAARMSWRDKRLEVDNVCVHRPGQSALITGTASVSPADELHVILSDIDLNYVFETLNINYVTFGGSASGLVKASALLSGRPLLRTDGLLVEGLTYNNSLLGNAMIRSYFNNEQKSVRIDADILESLRPVARVGGDIFVTRDSLSIGFEADSLNVGFLQPFMAAFSSKVEGRASGKVLLYGTFKDINLVGRVHADTLRMKIDVTNTYYSARDSVIIDPGVIHLDHITLRDRNGHTAMLNGEVRHRYFHEPTFDFSITNARNFLCYDTKPKDNPVWWGTIYGNGSGKMHGVPGYISVEVDMTSAPGSTFTFVLDDHEEAVDYEFITFTDKRKEAEELRLKEKLAKEAEEPEFLKRFRRMAEESQQASATRYDMDLRMRATTDAQVNIIMDPVAGDKIAATGTGALRMTYNSDDELNLYGTYTLSQGLYNFTLQDLIVRDFKIREGSKISFNGDPLQAMLSLTAAYKVNTSLTELDKSFATDRELNRTNVPVEALLKVDGELQNPEINFDLDFPTLSTDVAGKVKSIISTSDMMSRQIIYLLALNRFYTPDYMNTDGNSNELASVASTTLSTQLGQMLGQLAPGWTFSPYFRTDKGDFSDMEVDLALSSALFNNRLLLNGNLGYRDRSTSSTTFVGDFDIEYLLNSSGSLRLKAYNHFNDQNYYLRSALTTQGIGILYKRDFNRFLPGLFRKRRPKAKQQNRPTGKEEETSRTAPAKNN